MVAFGEASVAIAVRCILLTDPHPILIKLLKHEFRKIYRTAWNVDAI